MSNYVPGYQKRNRIFSKRVRELEHAVKHGAAPARLAEVAESVREAKLKALQAQSEAPPRKRVGDLASQVDRWRKMTAQEIIENLGRASST